MEKRKIIGFISIIIGVVFLLDSQLTGAVISTSIGTSISFFIGIVLLIGGIELILIVGRRVINETVGGIEIILTDRFSRAIKKHDLKRINNALKKIGTGLGHEETLRRDRGLFSIRASDGARALYRKDNLGRIVTETYLSAHEYDLYLKKNV